KKLNRHIVGSRTRDAGPIQSRLNVIVIPPSYIHLRGSNIGQGRSRREGPHPWPKSQGAQDKRHRKNELCFHKIPPLDYFLDGGILTFRNSLVNLSMNPVSILLKIKEI